MNSHLYLLLSTLWLVQCHNNTDPRVKSKRTLSGELQAYSHPGTVFFYQDDQLKPQVVAQVVPRAGADTFYSPSGKPAVYAKVFEPPKVAAQQVLYEYQQTPTNTVSNVHVKQLFQPEIVSDQNPIPNVATSETVVTPVQHSHVINNHPPYNPQAYNNIRTHPLYNIPPTQQYQIPKKYIFVNGKFIYDPNVLSNQQYQGPPNFFHSAQQFPQGTNQYIPRPLPQVNYFNNHIPKPNLVPPQPGNAPSSYKKFQAPPRHQMQPINVPSHPPPRQEHHSLKEEERPVKEDEEEGEEGEDKSAYDEEDYDKNPIYGKYTFDEDSEDDSPSDRYRDSEEDDDEDDDNKRSPTRYITYKLKKYPKKSHKPSKKREYYYNSRYEYPYSKHPKKNGKKITS